MKVGIGLPATIPNTPGELILDWARRADEGPFSSLGVIDRIAYNNYEPLIALAAAAGVTRRIRLMTTVLVGPQRSPGVLAKQAASLDAISGGRLTLGLGVGGRQEDYLAAGSGIDFEHRGRTLLEQLELMRRAWSGQPPVEGVGVMGPKPVQEGGPEILIGGSHPNALRRAGRYAHGYIGGGGLPPENVQQNYAAVLEAWNEARRPGKPRLVATHYFGLGPGARQRGRPYIMEYYRQAGPRAEMIANGYPASVDEVRQKFDAYADAGVDELILWPVIPELDQVDMLAEVVREVSPG